MNITQTVARLADAGAAVIMTGDGSPFVVGYIRQAGPDRWFWFEAEGVDEFAGHWIEATAKEVAGGAVRFDNGNAVVAYMEPIDWAFEDDVEAKERARQILADWRSRYGKDRNLRGFIERMARR